MTDLTHAYAVVLAGGYGERFWPASTAARPKQLLSLLGDRTMLEMAVDRLTGLIPVERVIVLTSHDLVEATLAATPDLPSGNVIGEPMRRDTAAAVALAAALVKARDPEGVFCIVTADHVMGDLDRFRQTLREGLILAGSDDVLITIGMTPRYPATGFGYIRAVDTFGAGQPSSAIEFRKVERFVEKPDRATAEGYVESGEYWWNSGMFIWSVDAVQQAFAEHRPELATFIDELVPSVDTPKFADALAAGFEPLEKISIDYALMERADNIVMAVGTFAWDDVGSWPAVGAHLEQDAAGNAVRGEIETLDASSNIVVSEGRVTALIGVNDLIVVHTETATLIVPKDRAEDVKALVSRMRADPGRSDLV
jgi:mannose-1-phosphate guanylyltransferase